MADAMHGVRHDGHVARRGGPASRLSRGLRRVLASALLNVAGRPLTRGRDPALIVLERPSRIVRVVPGGKAPVSSVCHGLPSPLSAAVQTPRYPKRKRAFGERCPSGPRSIPRRRTPSPWPCRGRGAGRPGAAVHKHCVPSSLPGGNGLEISAHL